MKFNKLICLALLAVSTNAFAYRVISEKMTSTPGFNVHYDITTSSKKKVMPTRVHAMAVAFNATGHPMEYIKIDSQHMISVINSTDKKSRFTYIYKLNCSNASSDYEKTIELDPEESFDEMAYSYATVQEQNAGSFGITASTKIESSENAFDERKATLRVQ